MKLSRDNVPFTMIANEVLNRKDLSLKAKGMYAYLFSKPEDWDFSSARIKNDSSDGRHATLAALQELEDNGLLTRVKQKNGRMDYHIGFATQSQKSGLRLFVDEKPKSGFRSVRKPLSAKTAPVSNTEKNTKKENKEDSELKLAGVKTNDLIELFKPVNPSYERLFSNTTQRAAIDRMVKKWGPEKVRNAILAACNVYGKEYAPTITTPLQLESKLGQLGSYVKKESAVNGKAGLVKI